MKQKKHQGLIVGQSSTLWIHRKTWQWIQWNMYDMWHLWRNIHKTREVLREVSMDIVIHSDIVPLEAGLPSIRDWWRSPAHWDSSAYALAEGVRRADWPWPTDIASTLSMRTSLEPMVGVPDVQRGTRKCLTAWPPVENTWKYHNDTDILLSSFGGQGSQLNHCLDVSFYIINVSKKTHIVALLHNSDSEKALSATPVRHLPSAPRHLSLQSAQGAGTKMRLELKSLCCLEWLRISPCWNQIRCAAQNHPHSRQSSDRLKRGRDIWKCVVRLRPRFRIEVNTWRHFEDGFQDIDI